VWNACSFLQHLPGREEVVLPPGGGVVRIYHVLLSANSRAETVEELASASSCRSSTRSTPTCAAPSTRQ